MVTNYKLGSSESTILDTRDETCDDETLVIGEQARCVLGWWWVSSCSKILYS